MNRRPGRLAPSFYSIFFALLRFDNPSGRECNKFVKKFCEVILETRQFSSTGLEPELNPLHNPVLAANLDQWARVYAAAPPEKRSQAIRQLLSELEDKEVLPPRQDTGADEPGSHPMEFACWQCGRMNESGQLYCGFCGADTLPAQAKTPQPQKDAGGANFEVRPSNGGDSSLSTFRSVEPPSQASRQLDSLRELSFSTIYDTQESSRNGWRYAIAVFVLLCCLGALGYLQWKTQIRAAWNRLSGAVNSQSQTASQNPPQTTPPAATTNDQSSSPADSATSDTASSNGNNASAPLTSSAPATPEPGKPTSVAGSQNAPPQNSSAQNSAKAAEDTAKPKTEDQADEEAAAATPEPAPKNKRSHAVTPASRLDHESASTAGSSSQDLADNGSAELATAKEYLDGTSGVRNPAQAATWLWRAVGKKNPEALVLLSGLYLHGDGVPKNCDQARLLLVAAAKKGAPNAGAQLRTFESSGCR